MKVKDILARLLYVHIQRLAGAPGVELLDRAPAVSRDRLLWQKLTLVLFQTLIFLRQRSGFWFLINITRFAMPGRVLVTMKIDRYR